MAARERFLTEAELREVWRGSLPLGDYGRIIRLLILTGQRRDEIGQMQWNEVNVVRREIALPAARCKNRRPHVVPLCGIRRKADSESEASRTAVR